MTVVPLSLRRAVEADAALLFAWANDPETRANSFSPELIAWAEHTAWLDQLLRDNGRVLYIIVGPDEEPIGQTRFDGGATGEAEISMSLAPVWRGRRLAAPAIRLATDRATADAGWSVVHAFVRPSNEASRRAFTRAGYLERRLVERKGSAAVHFVFVKD